MSSLHDTLSKFTNLYEEEESDEIKKKDLGENDIFSSPFTSEDGSFYTSIQSSADLMSKADKMNEEKKKRKKSSYDNYDINTFARDFEAELGEFSSFDDVADRLFEIDEDGQITITGDIDKLYITGGVATGLGFDTEKVNGTTLTSSYLEYSLTYTAKTSTTFGDLGISGGNLVYTVQNERGENLAAMLALKVFSTGFSAFSL